MKLPKLFPEWLETDGRGGYALGTKDLLNQRRYHSLYTIALNPPQERVAILKSIDMRLVVDNEELIFSNHYFSQEDYSHNRNLTSLNFTSFRMPSFEYEFNNGIKLKFEFFIENESRELFCKWELTKLPEKYKNSKVILLLKPLLSGNNHHHLLKADVKNICFESNITKNTVSIYFCHIDRNFTFKHNGEYEFKGDWYYGIHYEEEKQRGFDYKEDLYSPGTLRFDLASPAVLALGENDQENSRDLLLVKYEDALIKENLKRTSLEEKARLQFITNTKNGSSVIAGYPWFTDWGRDTFISLRGLCFSNKDFSTAESIILRWEKYISKGMIPNRFTDYGPVEYNSVDASLWFIICCYELLKINEKISSKDVILNAIDNILTAYEEGTRYNIKCCQDGLLFQGQAGFALTWMDARVDGKPITPRIGKAVEIQALWINALEVSVILLKKRENLLKKAKSNFNQVFWNAEKNYFYDYINKDYKDLSFRPNQIYAIGGLPFILASEEQVFKVLKQIETKLLTPFGFKSLSSDSIEYASHYQGPAYKRDSSYHQGTVWGYLLGAYFEAYLKANNFSNESKKYVQEKLNSFENIFTAFECGQTFEIFDAEAPNNPRGCPFQAWSLAEYLRVKRLLKD